MMIDFREIPQANKSNGGQDRFEQFACDFLETIGFKIIRRPDRGPDGKKDLIVSDTRTGVSGETTIKWLVSCKHFAHSDNSVKDTDEPDIYDRVLKHNCQGFLGFYSTLPSSTLSDKLYALRDRIEGTTYDSTRIERELLSCNQKERLLASYFPDSNDKYRQSIYIDKSNQKDENNKLTLTMTEEDVFQITKTAIIILEIEKIREEYFEASWDDKKNVLNKLYRFPDHSNERIASAIFDFLEDVAHLTSVKIPSDIAGSIHSLVLTLFPSSYNNDTKKRIENGKKMCLHWIYLSI